MPGNDVGERVHNFFAQDSLPQVQHHSPVVDVNWPTPSDNMWAESQRQIGVLSSNTKNYNLQNSDTGRGPNNYSFNGQHGLNFTPSILRPEFAKNQSQSQLPNLNGFVYGNQFYQTRQDEANFPSVDTSTDQRNMASGGSSFLESQQWLGPEQHTRTPVRSEPSDSPLSVDHFGGQQISHQQSNMLHSLQRQQSGISDMQQLQQQVMFMKMQQELQRQQQLHNLDGRQQNTLNQVSSSSKVASGVHSPALVNGTANSGALSHSWANELGWLQRGSPALQGSSGGLVPTNNDQAQRVMGLIPQQIDQSLYGVPVSSSRPFPNQFSQGLTDTQALQPMPTFNNSSFPVNQYAPLADQVNGQDGTFISRRRLQGENLFGEPPNQALTNATDVGNLQQADMIQKASAVQDFCDRQDIAAPSPVDSAVGAPSSENEVGLDPTEERILFGSDDNIWAAFGKSPMGGEGGSPFDGIESLDGMPSIQGGTWSALMQSAVAETSSSDVGAQEQFTGLNFHSSEIPSGGRTYNSGRHKASTGDILPEASSSYSGSVHPSDQDSYHNVQGHRFPFEPGKSLQSNSSQRLVQSPGLLAEGCQMVGKSSNPLDREMIAKNVSSSLAPELGGAREQYNKSAGWGVVESAFPSGDAASVPGENSFRHSQDYIQKKIRQGEVVRDVGWNSIPGRDTTVTMERAESSVGSPHANSEVFSLHNSAAVPNSITMRSGEEPSQFFQNNHQPNYWKNADVTEDNQVLRSSLDVGEKEGKMHEMENSDKQENSNDSHRSNLSPHSSAGGSRENVSSDARDSRFMPIGKQKFSNQMGRRNSLAHKFQYHPMGNLDKDAEPSYGMRNPTHSQPMLQQNAQHGQSKVFAQVPNVQAEFEKARSSDVLADGKGFGGQAFTGGSFPGGDGSNMSTALNRSVGLSSNTAPQSSENMLQFLHRVDPFKERGSMGHFSSSELKASSEVPDSENADGSASGHLQQSQSSASQVFGLQLGPPSQKMSAQTHFLSTQSPSRVVSSSHSSHGTVDIRETSQGQMLRPHHTQSLPAPSDLLQQQFKHNTSRVPGSTPNETTVHTMPGNFSSAFESTSGFTYSRNQLQYPHMVRASGRETINQSTSVSFEKHSPHSTEKGDSGRGPLPDGAVNIPYNPALSVGKSQLSNASGPHGSVSTNQVSSNEPVSVSQSSLMPDISLQGASSKFFTNMQTNYPPPHHFDGQYNKEPSHIPQPHQLNIMESSLSAPQRQGGQDANKGGTFMSELGSSTVNSLGSVKGEELRVKESTSEPVQTENVDLVQNMNDQQGRESSVKNLPDGSPASSASVMRDIQAFGRSLKPNNFPNQSFSLLNQMLTMKNTETDPSNRVFRRMMTPDSSASAQQVPSGDSRMLSFSGPEDLQRSVSFQHGGRMTPSDVAFCQDESQAGSHDSNSNFAKPEQMQISPQMAPSWFNQYGSLKNGQMLQMYDAHRAAAMKTAEEPFAPAMSTSGLHALNSMQQVIHATADRSQLGYLRPCSTVSSTASEHLSSMQMLPVSAGQQHPVLKPKKRKRATSELTPWYKEISLDLRSNQIISLADTEWAQAVNRLNEKVKEIDLIDGGPANLKARRRLMLTTQLMQQLFYPPPAAILSSDAKSEYESVAYSTSRLVLGDACSLVSCSDGHTIMSHDGKEQLPEKCKASEGNDRHHFAKAMEELMGRATKLESDFVSLDKRASVLDVIVEGQDLEKFSVFYRFAKFHGRGQHTGVESSTDTAAHSHKPFLERYVTALPMPKNLPDRVQCLSL